MNIYKTRLLNVAKALRESPNPQKFDMGKWGHFCGTPACALGHYAAREDLQSDFSLSFWQGNLEFPGNDHNAAICEHFGINANEGMELFSFWGCGDAATTLGAALYIEAFAERKWPIVTEPAAKKFIESLKVPA